MSLMEIISFTPGQILRQRNFILYRSYVVHSPYLRINTSFGKNKKTFFPAWDGIWNQEPGMKYSDTRKNHPLPGGGVNRTLTCNDPSSLLSQVKTTKKK